MKSIIPITDLSKEGLSLYHQQKENQLYHYFEPDFGLFIAESPNVILRALAAGYKPYSLLIEENQLHSMPKEVAKILDHLDDTIPVYTAKDKLLSQITGFHLTRGLLCAMRRKALPDVKEILKDSRRIAILENVVNPTNVGAIVRSAAALHMDGIIFTKGCADPLYRRAIRVSMGCIFQIPFTVLSSDELWPDDTMKTLSQAGFKTAAMALSDNSVSIDDEALLKEEKLAIVLGTEGDGLACTTIANCDYTVKIPMSNGVDSLNVAAASAVAFYQLGK